MKYLHVPALIFMLLFSFSGYASPNFLTYQGRIVKSDGTPLEYASVSFIFQVVDPSGQCVVYQEQVNGINMVNSGGVFDVPIGGGSVKYPLTGSFKILDAFNNSASFTCGDCSAGTCTDGTSTYNGVAGDHRILRVQFYDGSGWKTISPDSTIRSVPYAGYALAAQKLGSNVASDFLLKSIIPVCASGTFLNWTGTVFTCGGVAGASGGTVTDVQSTNSYLTITNGTSTPSLTLNVGSAANTVAAGNDPRFTDARVPSGNAGGDLGGTYPNPTLAKIKGVDLSIAALLMGQFLKYDGTNWVNTTLSSANLSDGASLIKASQMPANCSSGQTLTFSSPSGAWVCSSISLADSQITWAAQTTNKVFASPNGSTGAPTFRALTAADLPANAYDSSYFKNGGNAFAGAASVGTSDGNNLSLVTNSAARMTLDTAGNVGIGTTTPSYPLHVAVTDTSTASFTQSSFELTTNPAASAAGTHSALQSTVSTAATAQNYTGSLRAYNNSADHNGSGSLASLLGTYNHANNKSTGTVASAFGESSDVVNVSTGTITSAVGSNGHAYTSAAGGTIVSGIGVQGYTSSSAGTVTTAEGVRGYVTATAPGAITTAYGGRFYVSSTGGAVTNAYGLYIDNITGTNKWALYQSDATAPNYFAGNTGFGVTPSSVLHLKAGTATAGTSPLKFTAGTLLTTPENGAVEYDGTSFYLTSGATRYAINSTNTSGAMTGNVSSISNSSGSITMNPSAGNSVVINSATASTSSATGALVVSGGVGVAGALNVANGINSDSSIATQNSTAATAGANQSSPSIYLKANYWNGSASAVDQWSIQNILGTGTNPSSTLSFAHSGSSGSTAYSFMNGNVGIGTSGPASLLQIGGNNLSMPSWTTQGSHLYIPGVISTDTTGSGTIANRTVASIGTHTLAASNAETITTAATLMIASAPSAGTNVAITNPLALLVSASNSAFMGNVGVGTTAPSTNLEISATTPSLRISNPNVTIPDYSTTGFNPALSANTTAQWVNYSNTTGGYQLSGFTKSGTNNGVPAAIVGYHGGTAPTTTAISLTSYKWDGGTTRAALAATEISAQVNNAGSPLLTVLGGGHVGIGTTTPNSGLHVTTANGAWSTSGWPKNIQVGADGSAGLIRFPFNNSNQPAIGSSTDGILRFMHSGANDSTGAASTDMVITPSGNVGIGTIAPTSPLQVSALTTANSGTAISGTFVTNPASGTTTSTWGTNVSNTYATNGLDITSGGIRGGEFSASNNSTSTVSMLYGAVGVTNNATTGTVQNAWSSYGSARNSSTGTISKAYGGIFETLNSGGGTITNAYGMYVGNVQGTNRWSVYASDTAPSYFNGNVGIGTTTPGQKLSVAGTIESTSGGVRYPDSTTQTTAYPGAAKRALVTVSSGSAPTATVAISWGTVSYDTGTFWSAGSPTRLTIPAGVTLVRLCAGGYGYFTTGSGQIGSGITKNGAFATGLPHNLTEGHTTSTPYITNVCSAPMVVVAGDYFEYTFGPNGAGTVTIPVDVRTWFSIEEVR